MSTHNEEPRRLEINWVQTAGGALAALSSAVLLSTTGVAGTIIGAAVGSVLVTVGNSVYSHYLVASKERVAGARIAAVEAAGRVRGRTRGRATSDASNDPAPPAPAPAPAQPRARRTAAPVDQGPSWQDLMQRLPWKRLAAIAAGIFVLAMGAILAFEAVSGHAVSSYTGGSDGNGPRTSFGGRSDPKPTEPTERTEPTESTPTDPATTPTETTPAESEMTTTPPAEEETSAPTTSEPTTTSTTEPPPE